MQLKTIPEDFIVAEIARHDILPEGQYALLEMAKRNMTTERALQLLCESLGLERRHVGYAGSKDARAITRQYVTIRAFPGIKERVERLRRDNPAVRLLGFTTEPLSLGALEGNRFEIVVRKIGEERPYALASIPNYFDEQRFSSRNVEIGRLLLKKDFIAAAQAILTTEPSAAERMREHLEQRPTDGLGALRFIPKHHLLMYAHAYQSSLWNEVLSRHIREQDPGAILVEGPVPILVPTKEIPSAQVPLVGFGIALPPPFDTWYGEILTREQLTQRDFVVRALPFLSLEGGSREASFTVQDLEIGPLEEDELHPGRKRQSLSFVLPKSCYATIVVKVLYRTGDISGKEEKSV
jgi:tRNA pseudouridine13 synthase